MSGSSIYQQVERAAQAVVHSLGARRPKVGIVLGSGLGRFADTLEDPVAIPYGQIAGFAESRVLGHAGRLVAGSCGGTPSLVMQGRVHRYEGHPIEQVVLPVRTMILCGCETVIITNAAGGIRADLAPGDLVLISDHINLTGENPLQGPSDDRLGPRFPDMSAAYDAELRALARRAAAEIGLRPLKEGVYSWMLGPSYETPAEIRMLRTLGADLAGMSTVPEVIAANQMGGRVLGISCVTNMAAGLGGKLSHDDVKQTAERVEKQFAQLLQKIVTLLGSEGA